MLLNSISEFLIGIAFCRPYIYQLGVLILYIDDEPNTSFVFEYET